MKPKEFDAHMVRLDFTQETIGVAFGYSKRTGQRWASEGPPLPVAMVLATAEDRNDLDSWLAEHRQRTQPGRIRQRRKKR